MNIELYLGERRVLMPLLMLADDSHEAIAGYIDRGDVFVLRDGDAILGHLLLIADAPAPDEPGYEIVSMAVDPAHQGRGLGRALVTAALAHARELGATRVRVATATADVGNLRFYQLAGASRTLPRAMTRLASQVRGAVHGSRGGAGSHQVGFRMSHIERDAFVAANGYPESIIDGIPLRDRVWFDLTL